MKIEFSKFTSAGLVRENNQDSVFAAADGEYGLFAVADGMGGHFHGEIASEEIVSALEKWWAEFIASPYEYDKCYDELKQILYNVNDRIYDEYSKNGQICGSTVAILFIFRNRYMLINSGDTRIYSRSFFKIRQESVDHVYGREAVITGLVTKKEAEELPDGDRLTAAVGCRERLALYIASAPLGRKSFLICSDGVYKYCGRFDIDAALFMKDPTEFICRKVTEGGAGDNFSFVRISVK
ncbi:MAG: PP2C family protein-serine/threonine phosphatase [Oscillospiraceae bacterium]